MARLSSTLLKFIAIAALVAVGIGIGAAIWEDDNSSTNSSLGSSEMKDGSTKSSSVSIIDQEATSDFKYTTTDSKGLLDEATLEALYGPAALERAKGWVAQDKALWCGTADSPDTEPSSGTFPFPAPPTNDTYWPGACPSFPEAQALFDKAFAWRCLFNDNEAACAFHAASRLDPTCAMAYLGAALSMGPNVNYAFIVSPSVYRLILEALQGARAALANSTNPQSPFAEPLFVALSARYCVSGPTQLDAALALPAQEAFDAYNEQAPDCNNEWMKLASGMGEAFPLDPNVATLAVGALMELPAWKWWKIGSETAGSLANVSLLDGGGVQDAQGTAMGQVSRLQETNAQLSNSLLQRGLNVQPHHLGLLHFMIHNLEAGPQPVWGQGVGDTLYNLGGASQGHAAHMVTHIDMRVGSYDLAIARNWVAVQDDAEWNLARSGGGIMSTLYKYNPHNIAFIAEAAQHAGNYVQMMTAIQHLEWGAGFPLLANPLGMASNSQYLTRQLLQPLRFGQYEDVLAITGSEGPVQGIGPNATVLITLPGGSAQPAACGTCSDARLQARAVALSRLGKPEEAAAELLTLITSSSDGCGDPEVVRTLPGVCTGLNELNATVDVIEAAVLVSGYQQSQIEASRNATLGSSSSSASGTLTINNSQPLAALKFLVPAAELAGAQNQAEKQLALLRNAVATQAQLQYDEPAPYYYQIGETLAGALLKRGEPADIQEASMALQRVLFQWPRSALASVAMAEVLRRGPDGEAAAVGAQILEAEATQLNDTVMDLAWL